MSNKDSYCASVKPVTVEQETGAMEYMQEQRNQLANLLIQSDEKAVMVTGGLFVGEMVQGV